MAKKAMIIAIHGSLDLAYPPLIMASTAAAMDIETNLFLTFYGLNIVNRRTYGKLMVSPVGNPGMPLPMPHSIADTVSAMPGMRGMATSMMKQMFKKVNMLSIPELVQTCLDSGVNIYPCQMAMDVFGLEQKDLIDGLQEPVGAATVVAIASECDIHWVF
ncbi:MAG: DsrE/DsrF/DrsH-like family protein [Thermaerobacter sp.]|nr:DsrE/DsrF/DrsH-like family protein [Thermaerobacter sp.]